MKRITTKLTQRGQVTVPAEVQRLLGVKPRDAVSFIIEDGTVRITPAGRTIEELAGILKPGLTTDAILARSEEAKLDHADAMAREIAEP